MKYIIFDCDNCNKESAQYKEGYPYDDGWIYIHKFKAKSKTNSYIEHGDKHFCGPECASQFVKKVTSPKEERKEDVKRS